MTASRFRGSLLVLAWLASLALAHGPFLERLREVPVGPYRLSLFDDFHVGTSSMSLFVSADGELDPVSTEVTVFLTGAAAAPEVQPVLSYGAVQFREAQWALFVVFPVEVAAAGD